MQKLFAVYLGGRAERCNVELHDVVFVVGGKIEDTYLQLFEKWFGVPKGLHLDSWMELSVVDGHRVSLRSERTDSSKRLYFVNMGGYRPGEFTEHHAVSFFVAESEREVKERAKKNLLIGMGSAHTDDLYDVDDCLEISEVEGLFVHLEPTEERDTLVPTNEYHIVPRELIAEFTRRNG